MIRTLFVLFCLAPVTVQAETPTLTYVEHLTAGAKAEDRLPLIIAVHGLGDRPENFAGLFRDFPLPARVILPRGRLEHGRGWSWFPITRPPNQAMRDEVARSAAALSKLAQHLATTRPTVGRPVITGFSQGGILSFAIATQPNAEKAFAAALPVAGTLTPELWPKSAPKLPIHAFHGAADQRIKAASAQALVKHLKGLGADARIQVFPGVPHRIPPVVRQALFEAIAAVI